MDPTKEKVKTQKVIPVKNKTPAPLQITAEQLLREAKERQLEYVAPVRKYIKISCLNAQILFRILSFKASKTKNQ